MGRPASAPGGARQNCASAYEKLEGLVSAFFLRPFVELVARFDNLEDKAFDLESNNQTINRKSCEGVGGGAYVLGDSARMAPADWARRAFFAYNYWKGERQDGLG
jgi:hypothetical protein